MSGTVLKHTAICNKQSKASNAHKYNIGLCMLIKVNQRLLRADCVQSSRLWPWHKREDLLSSSHADTMYSHSGYKVKVAQWKSFLSKLCVVLSRRHLI